MTITTQSNSNTNDIQNATATETSRVGIDQIVSEIQSVCTLPESLIKAVLATCISVKMDLPTSLWLMVIGVPSSAKTDLVNFLRSFGLVYFVDTLTQNPFASGYVAPEGKKSYDMLPQVNDKCLVVKDYTTIFSLSSETVKKLLGELVSIYDGQFKKFSPTRGLKEYTTNFSHLGCITPSALNRHTNYMNIIGPRFLFYRIPKLDEEKSKKGFEIAWRDNRKAKLKEIEKLVNLFLEQTITGLENEIVNADFVDENIKSTLEQLAIFTSKSRGIVITQEQSFKDEEDKTVTYTEVVDWQVEEPWRAFQQLKGLATALCVVNQTYRISNQEISVLEKIVLSSMPVQRAEVLECFKTEKTLTAKQLSQLTKKSLRTCQRLLKELQFLGIIDSPDSSSPIAKEYSIKVDFASFFTAAPPKFMSRLDKELAENPTAKLRSLLAINLKLLTDDELHAYEKTAADWLMDNLQEIHTSEYDFIHSIWEKVDTEAKRRAKLVQKTNQSTEANQASLIEEGRQHE